MSKLFTVILNYETLTFTSMNVRITFSVLYCTCSLSYAN